MADERPAAEVAEPFESLSALRAEHVDMMRTARRDSHDAEFVGRIRKFIDRVKATGTLIDSPADRDAAQNIITYWTSSLFMAADAAALSAAPPILDPFDPANAPDLSKVANPYQGLNAFGAEDAGRFFGREEAIKALLDKLRDQPVVLVIGPMGSGKTSLVTAGVIPRLKSRMAGENKSPVIPVVVSGTDPFATLLRSIHETAANPALPKLVAWISEQKKNLERDPGTLRALLETVFSGRPVIITVDQFEQIFTLCTDPQAREQFAQALIGICPEPQTSNRIILIVDERFQRQTLQLAALKSIGENPAARFYLPPLTLAEVRRIIESSAATVGLKFDEGIVEDLAKEVAGDVKALPTLQFTLHKLWNERTRDRITWEAYRKVGKPREALIRTSDAVFASLSPDDQNVARKLFLELVHPTVEGGFIRRRIRRDVLMQIDAPAESVTRVLERYVEAGLIQLTPGMDWDGDRFDVAHETLINNSPRLREWLQREREESEKKLQLITTARLWQESGFKSGYLLSDDALDEAAAYTESAPELKQLVAASKEAIRRRQQRVAWIRNAVMAVMALLIVFAFWQRNNAVEQRANAEKEAQAAQRSAESALKAVSTVLSVVAAQVDAGTIPIAAAKELLETAGRIFSSVEQRQELAGTRADLLTKFSDVYVLIGDRTKALTSANEAKALAQSFVSKDPDNDDWQRRLYESAYRIGDLLEAKDRERASQEFMLAVQTARNRAAKNPDNRRRQEDIAFIENKIGDIWRAKGDPQQALEHYRAALAIGDQLRAREPEHPERQKAVGDARMRIGELLTGQGHLSDALAEYQIALPIREALARNYPQNDIYQSNLSTSYDRLGTLYKRDNKPDEALLYYEKAFEIRDNLVRKDLDNAEWQSALAYEHVAIADVLANQVPERAVERYRYALTIRERLAAKDVSNIPWTRNVAETYERIGDTLKGQGESRKAQDDLRNALGAYQRGLTVIEAFMRKDPNSGLDPVRDRLLKKIQGLAPSVQ